VEFLSDGLTTKAVINFNFDADLGMFVAFAINFISVSYLFIMSEMAYQLLSKHKALIWPKINSQNER